LLLLADAAREKRYRETRKVENNIHKEPDGFLAPLHNFILILLLNGEIYENDFNQRCVARARTLEANLMAAAKCVVVCAARVAPAHR
jgi:hypothetical protein